MNQPTRQVYYKVPQLVLDDLIQQLKLRKDFTIKKFVESSEKSHFNRYSFVRNSEKVSIVFDIKAEMLTVTADADTVDTVNTLYGELSKRSLGGKEKEAAAKKSESATIVRNSSKTADTKKLNQKEQAIDRQAVATKQSASKSVTTRQQSDIGSTLAGKKKKGVTNAQTLNSYASETRVLENSTENHFVDYNYQEMLKFRINGAMKLESVLGTDNNNLQQEKSLPKKNLERGNPKANMSSTKSIENTNQQKIGGAVAKKEGAVTKKETAQPISKPLLQAVKEKPMLKAAEVKPLLQMTEVPREIPEYKDGYSVKKVSIERVKDITKGLEEEHSLKVSCLGTVKGTAGDIVTYSIENKNKIKVYLRHIVKKNMLQLQGKRSDLFSEIQILISRDEAVTKNSTSSGEQAGSYKEVKKALPNAFEFLSEQSKIDFTIGLIDINSDEVRLSDYSVLLVPPYRGLERLLYDLQRAKNIEVKLIGQAFEKDNGAYTLKSGYKRKINSIVYNEVLSALYTEYFERRNFFAHSNNTDEALTRVITEKQEAKVIFENLISVINYNCKKLKEIGFTI